MTIYKQDFGPLPSPVYKMILIHTTTALVFSTAAHALYSYCILDSLP